eukprot:scaffold3667_cov110-Isochrysis_galbana.AAC.4
MDARTATKQTAGKNKEQSHTRVVIVPKSKTQDPAWGAGGKGTGEHANGSRQQDGDGKRREESER